MEFWRKYRLVLITSFVILVLFGIGRVNKKEETSRPLNELTRLAPTAVVRVRIEIVNEHIRRFIVERRDGKEWVYTIPVEMAESLRSKIEGMGIAVVIIEKTRLAKEIFLDFGPLISVLAWFAWSRHKEAKKPIDEGKTPRTKFADVGGYHEVKEELRELVVHLRRPDQLKKMGGRTPKGVLLCGPPGTGKTLFARAVAGEAGVPFFTITGSEFVEMYVGVGASRVRRLFEAAKKHAPCIIFIDELDAVGARRNPNAISGEREHSSTLNQLLTEMDGFSQDAGIVILAATNHPEALDAALIRPGRFDRRVEMTLPDLATRSEILSASIASRQAKIDPGVDVVALARSTPGFSGAALDSLVNEAALQAVRMGSERITSAHFDQAMDRVIMGLRQARVMSPDERKIIARHEAGHTIVALYTEGASPVAKVTIVAHGGALGMMVHGSSEDRHISNRTQLIGSMAVALGGRIAEEIHGGEDKISNGAADDLQRSTAIAVEMATRWGFGPRGKAAPLRVFTLQGYTPSPRTAEEVDDVIEALIKEAGDHAREVLTAHQREHALLVDALLERETLTREEISALLNASP